MQPRDAPASSGTEVISVVLDRRVAHYHAIDFSQNDEPIGLGKNATEARLDVALAVDHSHALEKRPNRFPVLLFSQPCGDHGAIVIRRCSLERSIARHRRVLSACESEQYPVRDRFGSSMSYSLRDAVESDAAVIADIYVAASLTALSDAANHAAIRAAADGAHALWRPLRRPEQGQWMLVAEEDSIPVGFSSFGVAAADRAHLYALYVAPSCWSTGVGGQLLATSMSQLRETGIAAAELWVQDENARAQRFYATRGWAFTGKVSSNDRGVFREMSTTVA